MIVRARHIAQKAVRQCHRVAAVVHDWIMELEVEDRGHGRH
ncbi:hypothetical protein SAMN07250955_11128 [Arboricoccus pini]|uniref:Uncharacterized protein n=1 Tax=Arboricoccus pini TaxID=1963835 RepID=A0A212RN10_9PROT|nr:hypothetical protein [Arboricoccus pini]SNB73919.1 hypothetical protein SAMN07250955_11128 [Arboricoccus pini]